MWEDEIVEEVRTARDEYAAKFNYDLEAIYKDIKEQEEQSRRRVVSLPPKKPDLVELTSGGCKKIKKAARKAASLSTYCDSVFAPKLFRDPHLPEREGIIEGNLLQ